MTPCFFCVARKDMNEMQLLPRGIVLFQLSLTHDSKSNLYMIENDDDRLVVCMSSVDRFFKFWRACKRYVVLCVQYTVTYTKSENWKMHNAHTVESFEQDG